VWPQTPLNSINNLIDAEFVQNIPIFTQMWASLFWSLGLTPDARVGRSVAAVGTRRSII